MPRVCYMYMYLLRANTRVQFNATYASVYIASSWLSTYHSLSRASPQSKTGKPCPSQCGSTVGPTNNPRHVVLHVPHWLAEWDICSGRHNRRTWDPNRSGGSDSVYSVHHCLHWQHNVCGTICQFHLQHNTEWVMIGVNIVQYQWICIHAPCQFYNLCHQAVGHCMRN